MIHDLLTEAISKHDSLLRQEEWRAELIERSVPVLWFGDSTTPRKRIVTLAANPSRSEFLNGRGGDVLEGKRARFFVRDTEPVAGEVLDLDAISASFDYYFAKRPYATWFGKKEGGKVEALLNGMNASFYNEERRYGGLHIDLFPFATRRDFRTIAGIAQRDLFESGWAHRVLTGLLDVLSPEAAIITGVGNLNHVNTHCNQLVTWTSQTTFTTDRGLKTDVHVGRIGQRLPLAAVSVNLGNPMSRLNGKPCGWRRDEIVPLGAFVAKALGLSN